MRINFFRYNTVQIFGLLLVMSLALMLSACTKDGDVIYMVDPNDPQPSDSPLIVAVYDANAVGDCSYNDLIYKGIENVAVKYGARAMQISPSSFSEGKAFLEKAFAQAVTATDTLRRLFIVTSTAYDSLIRANNKHLESNPYTDLLYLETPKPLEGKGSTLFVDYYGAMYEAGYFAPLFGKSILVAAANPVNESVSNAVSAFADGFNDSPYEKNKLKTEYIGSKIDEGFSISDSAAVQLLNSNAEDNLDGQLIVPICGSSSNTIARISDNTQFYRIVGIDRVMNSSLSDFSVVKHIDKAVSETIEQWMNTGTMEKHRRLGIAAGYTSVVFHPHSNDFENIVNKYITQETLDIVLKKAIEMEGQNEH